ncbi:glycoside hydrolase superfamily, partial [Obelidium mucronatum]
MQILSLLSIATAVSALTASDYLWPLPKSVVDKNKSIAIGGFTVKSNLGNGPIAVDVASLNTAFTAKGGKASSNKFKVTADVDENNGWDIGAPDDLVGKKESYTLDITEKGATITAANQIGVKYGLQTLSQLITKDGKLVLATIKDEPAFPYRGLMLDTARNFFTVADIKRILDGMAASKLNVFHWHIYDSQSFPIVWDRYPQLKKAAFKNKDGSIKAYTKKDVREIVMYAYQRNIRVIPEFETPGHNAVLGHIDAKLISSWNHSPWDGNSFANNAMCSNQTVPVDKVTNDCVGGVAWWGRHYCNQPPCGQLDVRKQRAIDILEEMVSEIGGWFDDPILHVGHDEVNARAYGLVPDNWDVAPLETLHPMMRNFDKQLVQILKDNDKTLAAWDEIATDFGSDDVIPKNSLITLWQGPTVDKVKTIVSKGFKNIVLAPSDTYYLDCSPSARWCSSDYERNFPADKYDIPGYATFSGQWHNWTLIYDYEPLAGLSTAEAAAIKGGFGALWTETVKRHNLDRYVFPRVAAIAERFWSNTKRNDATATRLNRFRASLVNEKGIAAAELSYLGNKEGVVYRTEYCDGAGLTAPGQKTGECCFAGQKNTDSNGGPLLNPYSSHFDPKVNGDYCAIAALYKTNDLVYTKPAPVAYEY